VRPPCGRDGGARMGAARLAGARRSGCPSRQQREDDGAGRPVRTGRDLIRPGSGLEEILHHRLGALVGWPDRLAVSLGLCVVAGLVAAAAIAGFVPGLPGLWLDGAALMLPVYCAACLLGALGRRLAGRT
ncbi:hypothetical protein OMR07_21880, partial [Methylobacterium organophilum]|nr:hypothetical protein [Methylobacterium organophilum]